RNRSWRGSTRLKDAAFTQVRCVGSGDSADQIGSCAATVRKNEPHFRIFRSRAAGQQALDRACRVGAIFDRCISDAWKDVLAAKVVFGMSVDNRSASIEFFIDWSEHRITEVLVSVERRLTEIGEQIDSICF